MIKRFFLAGFLFFTLFINISFAERTIGDADLASTIELITNINESFRTSARAVAAQTLWEQATERVSPALLRQLSQISEDDLLSALFANRTNQGLAQNILKLRAIAVLCSSFCAISDRQDNVPGLSQKALDELVTRLPATTAEDLNADNFNYARYEIAETFKKSILDNDRYNFRVAAGYWAQGWHESKKVTFSLFSRGKKNRPFIVTAGQEIVLHVLENLRFRERDIQHLKSHSDFRNVPEEFFDYLRNFKFTGTVRGMKPGTIAFANEPIIEITGNPVEAQIVETIVIPIINSMSNFATKSARMGLAVDFSKPYVEGGTRRGVDGIMSAIAAYIGGATGTSNDEASRLFNIPAFGSMNHAWVMLNGSEAKSFNLYNKLFPGITMLVDTYDIMRSIRIAALVVGDSLSAIRLDSTMPNKTKSETATAVREHLNRLGLQNTKIIYSDGLNEHDLAELKNAPIDSFLVGTELAAPSDANGLGIVYKVVEDIENGALLPDPVKLANGKAGYPGRKQVWRHYVQSTPYMDSDYVSELSELPQRGRATPLLGTLINEGVSLFKNLNYGQIRESVRDQLYSLPNNLKDLNADKNAYTVNFSENLKQRMSAAQERLQNHQELTAIFHEVDVQKTFWKGMHGEADGPLAVSGSSEITENIARLKAHAAASMEVKSIASIDYHYDVEVNNYAVNSEFHPEGANFPPHAMSSGSGAVGAGRIPEVENAYAANKRIHIPHQVPSGTKLRLVNYNLKKISREILDPSYEIVIRKNGQNSYNVFENPRTEEIYARVNPGKHIPIYVYGVATDFCVKAAALGFLERGYRVFVIEDAITGVFENTTQAALQEMKAAGAVFVKTADVISRISTEESCEVNLKKTP